MNWREFLFTSGTVPLAAAAPTFISATVLYGDRFVSLDKPGSALRGAGKLSGKKESVLLPW